MKTSAFFELLQTLAPLELAESWDNVGVLLDRGAFADVSRVLLTIDLTWAVLQEAITHEVQAIVAYHPPIFSGLKRIVPTDPKGQLLGELLARGLIVYSPHTALDSVPGGVNDWLADAFDTTTRRPVVASALGSVAAPHPTSSAAGQGRIVELSAPINLDTAVSRLKSHLGLSWVRASRAVGVTGGQIRSVALCAGAGGSLLAQCRADLVVTGEMRHHDVLELASNGVNVILTDHTHSERGYLPVLRSRLCARAPDLEVVVSTSDAEPLRVV